jgi:hypothetical protein
MHEQVEKPKENSFPSKRQENRAVANSASRRRAVASKVLGLWITGRKQLHKQECVNYPKERALHGKGVAAKNEMSQLMLSHI